MSGANGPVVYLTTFSKSLAPGMRIACMVLPQSLLARYRRDFATYANTVSRFEQQTLCEFMAGGYFTRHLARMRLAYIWDAQQSKVNEIKTHTYSHVFMVGFVKELYLFPNKRK